MFPFQVCFTTLSYTVIVVIPSVSVLCPTTEGVRSSATQPNTELTSLSASCILHPNPSQNSYVWYTFLWADTQLQSLDWLTATVMQQTLGCWRFSSYSLVVSCIQLLDASHIVDCSWVTGQILKNRWDTRQTLPHLCNTDVHLSQCAFLFVPPLCFDLHLTGDPSKTALSC